jgi:O-methyltransferase
MTPIELDQKEREIVDSIMSERLTMVSKERLWATVMACKYVAEEKIEGDFVECGVWRGGNAIAAAEIFRLHDVNKTVWLFDTFAGMTNPTEEDIRASDGVLAQKEFLDHQRESYNSWCYASVDEVRKNFASRELCANVVFVEGDVCETLNTQNLPEKICILRLDTDWYESTKKELEILYPKISLGGCLIVDDYGHWRGSKKATDEYFRNNGSRPFLQYTDYTGRMAVKVVR